jgi:cyclic pyranopterin monophosphate synthase
MHGKETAMPIRNKLSHISNNGKARMIDVGLKRPTHRTARAEAWVEVGRAIAARLRKSGGIAKGNVLETARIAGIMAAKRTAELIPMCHPLPVGSIALEAKLIGNRVHIESEVRYSGKTGVEMEALTAVSVAALTVYDMCKSAGKGIVIGPIRLLEKTGGKSGNWRLT